MNNRKTVFLVSLVTVLSLSAAAGWTLLKPSDVETPASEPDVETPPIDETPEDPEILEKPKFHIFDAELEFSTYPPNVSPWLTDMRISFKLQNLGNVTASGIVISYDIKISSGNPVWVLWPEPPEDFVFDGEIFEDPPYEDPYDPDPPTWIKFLWVRGNVTIDMMDAKETNEYYIYDVWDALVEGVGGGIGTAGGSHIDFMILGSYWNLTCTEGVAETFELH